MSFSEKIRTLRMQRGYSQEQLARKLYVSRATIAKWETSDIIPQIDSLIAIAKFFDVTLDYLLMNDEK